MGTNWFGRWGAFIVVVVTPLAVALAIWATTAYGINTLIVEFNPCQTITVDKITKKSQIEIRKECLFSPLPTSELETGRSGRFTASSLPANEVRSRYLFLLLLFASVSGAIILYMDSLRSIYAVSSKRWHKNTVKNPTILIGVISIAVGITVGAFTESFANTVTEPIFRSVLKAIPWAQDFDAKSGRTVFWVLGNVLLPVLKAVFTSVIVIFVLAMAVQFAPPPYGRRIFLKSGDSRAADFLWRRIYRIRRMTIIAAAVLAFGIATFRAFVDWPVSILDGVGYKFAATHARTLTAGVVLYWSTVCVAILLSTYLTAMYCVSRPVRKIAPGLNTLSQKERDEWAKKAGLRVNFTDQVKLVGSLLAPLLIGTGDRVAGALLSF